MATPDEIFENVDNIEPIAAMWTSLRGQLRGEGMPADVADECVKSTGRMMAASQESTTAMLQITLAKIQARIMGVDITDINKEN